MKKMLTSILTKRRSSTSRYQNSKSKLELMKNEDFYAASMTITTEKMNEKKGQVTECEVLTAAYLRKLHSAPDAHSLEQFGRRYKG